MVSIRFLHLNNYIKREDDLVIALDLNDLIDFLKTYRQDISINWSLYQR